MLLLGGGIVAAGAAVYLATRKKAPATVTPTTPSTNLPKYPAPLPPPPPGSYNASVTPLSIDQLIR